jgi:hypothetical protein
MKCPYDNLRCAACLTVCEYQAEVNRRHKARRPVTLAERPKIIERIRKQLHFFDRWSRGEYPPPRAVV